MSYDIRLKVDGQTVRIDKPHQVAGGTYCPGGTDELWLNVTYNYGQHFWRVLGEEGIRTIYGMTAEESIPVLREAAERLGGDPSDDYWEPTEGNARAALLNLISLAEMAPEPGRATWSGD